jgi:hypothetical protein
MRLDRPIKIGQNEGGGDGSSILVELVRARRFVSLPSRGIVETTERAEFIIAACPAMVEPACSD